MVVSMVSAAHEPTWLTNSFNDAFTGSFGVFGRLALDVVAMVILVWWLYRRSIITAPEMSLVFTALNIGLFAAVASIGTGDFPTGVGFGLFGLLSLIRLRSAAFTLKDVAYTFIALVLALINGLQAHNPLIVAILNIVLLVAVWLVDDARTPESSTSVMRMKMRLDQALTEPEQVRAEVTARLGMEPVSIAVEAVDFVRETTRVSIQYTSSSDVGVQS